MVDVNDRGFGEAAYCHHRHHLDEHSTDFDNCPHPICVKARSEPACSNCRHPLECTWGCQGRPLYDKSFGDDRQCRCGHVYYRHFDSYEEMRPVGCKYCGCPQWKAPIPLSLAQSDLLEHLKKHGAAWRGAFNGSVVKALLKKGLVGLDDQDNLFVTESGKVHRG
jgi:hypothetical protein